MDPLDQNPGCNLSLPLTKHLEGGREGRLPQLLVKQVHVNGEQSAIWRLKHISTKRIQKAILLRWSNVDYNVFVLLRFPDHIFRWSNY